jgi:NitT/TauT family transport system permease protein
MCLRWLVGALVLLVLWTVCTVAALVSPLILPTPWSVAEALAQGLGGGGFLRDMGASLYRLLFGFTVGAVAGVIVGVAFGLSRTVYSYAELAVDFFRSLPVITVFPLFMAVFGLGDTAKVATTIWAVFLIVTVSTIYGIRQVPRTRVLATRTLGAKGLFLITHVVIPSAVPSIIGSCRVAISLGLIVVVMTEMFTGTDYGLGKRIYNAGLIYEMPTMYGAILITGLLGYLLNKVIMLFEQKLSAWCGG